MKLLMRVLTKFDINHIELMQKVPISEWSMSHHIKERKKLSSLD